MAATNSCPTCGGPIPGDAPAGQCPACLMGVADGPETAATRVPRSPFEERRFGDYVLGRQLGSGGMGIVYEAHQLSLNRKVALKFIRDSQVASPNLLRRFTIEAEATARLHHPGIVGIHEIGELEGHPYFTMDLVEGDNLRTAIVHGRFVLKLRDGSKSNGRSVQVEIARLMAKTARAVHHAHQRGVLHRDLKPANILIDRQGEPRLTDFGLAKILRDTTGDGTASSLTPDTEIAGTAGYMSPEQASSEKTTSASDVYGLGAVLYELLTGQPPFKAATLFETLKQVQEQPPRRPGSVNPLANRDLETICLKCLEKEPAHRYASAEALAEDLEHWIEHRPIKARAPGPIVRIRQWMTRNPAGTAVIALLLLGLTGALILLDAVNRQRKQFEYQQALLFEERVNQLRKDWDNTTNRVLVISARDLAILGTRTAVDDPSAQRLSLGASVRGDPVTYAQNLTDPLAEIQTAMSQVLPTPVVLEFAAIKSGPWETDPLRQGDVAFMVMEATDYLLLKRTTPGLRAVARINNPVQGVLAANDRCGVTNLQQLVGKPMAFPAKYDPLTVFAKARLTDAGILRKNLRIVTNSIAEAEPSLSLAAILPTPRTRSREIAATILRGEADVGVIYKGRFNQEEHNGLMQLATFSTTPTIIVARAGLETNTIAAIQSALRGARERTAIEDSDTSAFDWEESFRGGIPIDDTYFNDLREAMRKAARFDGEPDPFLPGPNAPAAAQK